MVDRQKLTTEILTGALGLAVGYLVGLLFDRLLLVLHLVNP
jgi:hypothetical protein